jgi:hypothetical protein
LEALGDVDDDVHEGEAGEEAVEYHARDYAIFEWAHRENEFLFGLCSGAVVSRSGKETQQ